VYFCRIISNASPISLGYSAGGSSLEVSAAVVGGGPPRDNASGLPLGPTPPPLPPPRAGALTAFFSISFSMLSK
jgi:hypothetical protein